MNTVFKFYYQVWVCFALGGALAFSQLAPRILPRVAPSDTVSKPAEDDDHALLTSNPGGSRQVPRRALGPTPTPDPAAEERGTWAIPLRMSWIAAFLLLLCGSLVFLVQGTAARVQDPALWAQVQPPPGGVQPQGLSLDGMAYMRGWYPGDYAALTWLNANPSLGGIPTIIEAASGPYQWYGRVSIYTGLPTVLGSGHEPEQRDPNEVYARQNDVQLFYTTGDPQAALDILHRYGVRYVYVGGLERDCPTQSGSTCIPASTAAVDKYATLVAQGALAPIYQHLGVVIYRVVR